MLPKCVHVGPIDNNLAMVYVMDSGLPCGNPSLE